MTPNDSSMTDPNKDTTIILIDDLLNFVGITYMDVSEGHVQ